MAENVITDIEINYDANEKMNRTTGGETGDKISLIKRRQRVNVAHHTACSAPKAENVNK